MIQESLGQIDIGLCAQVITNAIKNEYTIMVIAIVVLYLLFAAALIAYGVEHTKRKSVQEYVRRKNLTNEYTNWEINRKQGR